MNNRVPKCLQGQYCKCTLYTPLCNLNFLWLYLKDETHKVSHPLRHKKIQQRAKVFEVDDILNIHQTLGPNVLPACEENCMKLFDREKNFTLVFSPWIPYSYYAKYRWGK